MRAFLLYGLAFLLMTAGVATIALAASLLLYLFEFAPNAPSIGTLIVIALVSLGCFAVSRGWLLFQALGMLEKLKLELRHEYLKATDADIIPGGHERRRRRPGMVGSFYP